MGGLIAVLYSRGLSLGRIATIAGSQTRSGRLHHLLDLAFSSRGLLRGERVLQSFAEAVGGESTQFRDLSIPVAVVSVDLRSGQEVVLASGSVAKALRATCSVPGLFLPVEYDDFTLVDGGLLNNVPADVVRQMGAEVVVAVDVLPDFSHNQAGQPPKVLGLRPLGLPVAAREQIHLQMIMISAITRERLRQARPDLLLQPELSERLSLFVSFR